VLANKAIKATGDSPCSFVEVVPPRLISIVMSKEMKTHYDLRQKPGLNSSLWKTQLLAASLSVAILIFVDLWLILAFRKTPRQRGRRF